jgi:hypothetical protein
MLDIMFHLLACFAAGFLPSVAAMLFTFSSCLKRNLNS